MQYFWCTTLRSPDSPADCHAYGPGSGGVCYGLLVFGGFVAQLLLVWLALVLMRFSVRARARARARSNRINRSIDRSIGRFPA